MDLIVYVPSTNRSHSPLTWALIVQGPHHKHDPTASDKWITKTGYLFKLVYLRTSPPMCWHLLSTEARTVGKQVACILGCFLDSRTKNSLKPDKWVKLGYMQFSWQYFEKGYASLQRWWKLERTIFTNKCAIHPRHHFDKWKQQNYPYHASWRKWSEIRNSRPLI